MGSSEASFGWGCDLVLDKKYEKILGALSEQGVLLKFAL